MKYRRANIPGATYFFTVNLADRKSNLLTEQINLLRNTIQKTRQSHPFDIIAMVILLDHLLTIWRLPESDAGFPLRWSLIKGNYSAAMKKKRKQTSQHRDTEAQRYNKGREKQIYRCSPDFLRVSVPLC